MVSERLLTKFKQIYFTKYGIQLTDEEATEQATAYMNLMTVLLKPPPAKKEESEIPKPKEMQQDQTQLSLL